MKFGFICSVVLVWGIAAGFGPSASFVLATSTQSIQGSSTGEEYSKTLQSSCGAASYPKQGSVDDAVSFDGRVQDLFWVGDSDNGSRTAFAVTYASNGYPGGPVWRGDATKGQAGTWEDVTEELKHSIEGDYEDDDLGVFAVHQSPVNANTVFLQGNGRWHWTSEDGGVTLKAVKSPGLLTKGNREVVKFHPNKESWLLLRTTRAECDKDLESSACLFDLLVSKDLGQSWKNLTEHSGGHLRGVRDFDWGAKLSRFNGRVTRDEDIFVTAYPGTSARKGMSPGWDDALQFFFSDDLFQSSPKVMVQCGNLFEIISDRIFLAIPSQCPVDPQGNPRKAGTSAIENRSVTMYVSVHGGDFVEACLPANIEDDGYNLIHTHEEEGVFVLADHAEPGSMGPKLDSPTSDAYAPAYNASLHTLSLGMVYRRSYVTDFARVEGIPGSFIANQAQLAAGSRSGYVLKTKLTVNGGAQWDYIKPPQSFRFSQCNTCTPGSSLDSCSLHLHGATSWFAPEGPHPNVYSLPEAPGILLATGNVGAYLDFHPDADCTYMSRDGGITWTDIADYTAIYEMSSSGGTIVMASHRSEGPTNEVAFSLDHGHCFHTITLPQSVLVENIRVAPGGSSNIFYVIGTACVKSSAHPDCTFDGGSYAPGLMFVVNLPELVGDDWKECSTDKDSKDYETWQIGDDCVLGAKRHMRRRTQDTFCANPPSWKPTIQHDESCQCTLGDVECEFGYERVSNDTCAPMKGVTIKDSCPRLLTGSYKSSTSHMRLVHNNICTGINAIIPDTNGKGGPKGSTTPGDDSSGSSSNHTSFIRSFFIFIIIVGGISIAAGITWSQCLTVDQQQALLEKLGPAIAILGAGFELILGAIVEAYDWIRAKLRRLPFVGDQGDRDDARMYYESLSGSGGLDMDPEDQSSPHPLR